MAVTSPAGGVGMAAVIAIGAAPISRYRVRRVATEFSESPEILDDFGDRSSSVGVSSSLYVLDIANDRHR